MRSLPVTPFILFFFWLFPPGSVPPCRDALGTERGWASSTSLKDKQGRIRWAGCQQRSAEALRPLPFVRPAPASAGRRHDSVSVSSIINSAPGTWLWAVPPSRGLALSHQPGSVRAVTPRCPLGAGGCTQGGQGRALGCPGCSRASIQGWEMCPRPSARLLGAAVPWIRRF